MERYLNAVRQRALRRSSKEKKRGWGEGRERKVEVRGAKHEVAYLVRFFWGECFFPLSIRERENELFEEKGSERGKWLCSREFNNLKIMEIFRAETRHA